MIQLGQRLFAATYAASGATYMKQYILKNRLFIRNFYCARFSSPKSHRDNLISRMALLSGFSTENVVQPFQKDGRSITDIQKRILCVVKDGAANKAGDGG